MDIGSSCFGALDLLPLASHARALHVGIKDSGAAPAALTFVAPAVLLDYAIKVFAEVVEGSAVSYSVVDGIVEVGEHCHILGAGDCEGFGLNGALIIILALGWYAQFALELVYGLFGGDGVKAEGALNHS